MKWMPIETAPKVTGERVLTEAEYLAKDSEICREAIARYRATAAANPYRPELPTPATGEQP